MLSFDHLVHFVHDPKQAIDRLGKAGFYAVEGGRHEQLGTINALCYLGLSYIEFLGVERREVAEQAAVRVPVIRQLLADLEVGEGPGTIAIRTNDIDQLAERLRQQGLHVLGPYPGSRSRTDGSTVSWSSLLLESEPGELPLPFFIQWEQNDEQRTADLLEQRLLLTDAEGPKLAYIGLVVDDAEQTADNWSRWFGLPFGRTYKVDELGAIGKRIRLAGGDLVFLSPAGAGKAADWLKQRGPRPYFVGVHGKQGVQSQLRVLGSEWLIAAAL